MLGGHDHLIEHGPRARRADTILYFSGGRKTAWGPAGS
jgi:hypothetical protein